jgi:hypothetical protein
MRKKPLLNKTKFTYESDKAHYRIQNYTVHSLFFGNPWNLPETFTQDNSVFTFKRQEALAYPESRDVIDLREVVYDYVDNKIVPYPRYNACVLWNPNGYLAAMVSRYRMYRYRIWSHVTFWFGDIDEKGIHGLWYTI